MAGAISTSLTDTLTLALAQCQEQVQIIQRQAQRIKQLQLENETLRKELENMKEKDKVQNQEKLVASKQVQDLFQQNIDAEAEIQRLQKKIKVYKEKASTRLGVTSSSPVKSSPTSVPPSIPQPSDNYQPSEYLIPSDPSGGNSDPSSPPRKRLKTSPGCTRDALLERSGNVRHVEQRLAPNVTRKVLNAETTTEKWLTKENGENRGAVIAAAGENRREGAKNNESHGRLDALLTSSHPVKSPLLRARSRGALHSAHHILSPDDQSPSTSNINHTPNVVSKNATDDICSTTSTKQLSDTPNGKGMPKSPTSRPEISITFEKAGRFSMKSTIREPLRKRPLQELFLYHFKPNPRTLADSNLTFGKSMIQGYSERIKALAATLPKLPGHNVHEMPLTEDDMLLDFLGQGAESRIAELSSSARKELLSRAKEERVAKAFASRILDNDTKDDAPAFWEADMPGTQENIKNKAVVKERERAEVEKRYHDAMTGRARWVFADE